MRFIGLTLCLLASSFGARADSVEDRVAALEARVKSLEDALHDKAGAPVSDIEGSYKGALPNGQVVTLDLKQGKAVAVLGTDSKVGTYEIIGRRLVVTVDSKPETFDFDGGHLTADDGKGNKIEFIKTK